MREKFAQLKKRKVNLSPDEPLEEETAFNEQVNRSDTDETPEN
jgi:hypothetical protein